jgi:hypothetical protein
MGKHLFKGVENSSWESCAPLGQSVNHLDDSSSLSKYIISSVSNLTFLNTHVPNTSLARLLQETWTRKEAQDASSQDTEVTDQKRTSVRHPCQDAATGAEAKAGASQGRV